MAQVPLEAWKVHFNWFYTPEGGEEYEIVEIGKENHVGGKRIKCVRITVYGEDYYQLSTGEIIEPFAVCEYIDGQVVQIANMNKIFFRPTEVK